MLEDYGTFGDFEKFMQTNDSGALQDYGMKVGVPAAGFFVLAIIS